ncbi:glycoside hydrolase family 3 protein [Tessaracoccus sp. MC1756]|uniref:glycoside hydrolase family 3 protein n=1 Tax=Tessaracoccus sp. MC1756 TaxID=2760311 RepID=UPI0016046CE2|nr:glycoside hydrolase family 3 protein [Tessaracoccus sp. MC1756]
MRRILAAAGVAALGLTGCATEPLIPAQYRAAEPALRSSQSTPAADVETTPRELSSPEAAPVDECRALAEELSLEQQVGQLFMVGVDTGGLDPTTRSAISDSRIGSVVLLGNTTAGTSQLRKLTAELGSLGTAQLPLLVAVDQEGGAVQRLKGAGFDAIPPARDQGALPPSELREAAAGWAEELHAAGIRYDLAPVADVVPEDKRLSNEPIGKLKRDFGAEPEAVSDSVVGFIEGMRSAGIATSVKHFPGLGEVTTNTDYGAAQDTDTTRDSRNLEPFRAAVEAGVDSVMVSSAVFEEIDPDNEGVFSQTVITDLLRGELGFDGVVIADDLGAAAAVKAIKPGERAVRFFDAGGDLVINANPSIMRAMVTATLEAAGDDESFAAQVLDSTSRVLRLKSAVGLVDCA